MCYNAAKPEKRNGKVIRDLVDKNTHKEVCKFVTRKSVSSFKVSLLTGEINWAPQQKTRARAGGRYCVLDATENVRRGTGAAGEPERDFWFSGEKNKKQSIDAFTIASVGFTYYPGDLVDPCWSLIFLWSYCFF